MLYTKLSKIFRYPYLVLIAVMLATVFFSVGMTKLTTDMSLQSAVGSKPSLAIKALFKDENKGDRNLSIIVHDNALFTVKNIGRLKIFQEAIEKNKYVYSVSSLYNLPDIAYYSLQEEWRPSLSGDEQTQVEVDEAKQFILSNKALLSKYINPSATSLAFVVTLKKVPDNQLLDARNSIEALIQSNKKNFQDMFQIGGLEVRYFSYSNAVHDMVFLGAAAAVVLIIMFGVLFKNVAIGFLPFITSSLSVVWVCGILGFTHVPLNALSSVMLVLVFTIGIMESAHFINCYVKNYQENPDGTAIDRMHATLRQVFVPILLATLTTMTGFAFNLLSGVKLLEDFSIAICCGLFVNMCLITLVTPALLHICKFAPKRQLITFAPLVKLALSLQQKLPRRTCLVALVLIVVVAASAFVMPKINFEVLPYINFYKQSEFMNKVDRSEQYISGTRFFSIYVSTKNPGGFRSKDTLVKLFATEKKLAALSNTSSTFSVASLMAAAYQVYLDGVDDEMYKIPQYQSIIDGFYDGMMKGEHAASLITENDEAVKLSLVYHARSTPEMAKYAAAIHTILDENLPPTEFDYEIDNSFLSSLSTVKQILLVQVLSILVIYLSVFLIMAWLFRSLAAGFISVLPNIFPVLGVLLFMFVLRLPASPATIIALAAVVGLAVDDTIHIMSEFRRQVLVNGTREAAIAASLKAQIRPVTITSITLILGISVLLLSSVKSVMFFGLLMIVGVLLAWVADFVLMPFLLMKSKFSSLAIKPSR